MASESFCSCGLLNSRCGRRGWEYAFAMGGGRDGGRNHPVHQQTRARTEELHARCRDLKARLAEHEL